MVEKLCIYIYTHHKEYYFYKNIRKSTKVKTLYTLRFPSKQDVDTFYGGSQIDGNLCAKSRSKILQAGTIAFKALQLLNKINLVTL